MPRRLAVAVITILAAGAAPALAAARSPLAQAVQTAQTKTDLNLSENLHTRAGDRQALHALIANAYACDQAATVVARIPASFDQQAAKAQWLSGIRLAARFDVQEADGVYTLLSGHKAAGWRELDALTPENDRVNTLVARADFALGLG